MTAALMFMGTGSDVGKSLIVAGLARAFANRGLTVMPFKPQNMSNNAAVTDDGGEIGRAQALQALAARVPTTVHMNPVLLKPESTTGAQVVVAGQRVRSMDARSYFKQRAEFLPQINQSFERLSAQADLVLVEGAGSPAEINLREGDLANMGFAEAANVPVILIGDIHRGGVIASLIGTLAVLAPEDAARIKGFLINNFHGDTALFDAGVAYLEGKNGRPVLGVVPHFSDARLLPAEDSLQLERITEQDSDEQGRFKIVVPRLKRMANFDDLDPLRQEPLLDVHIIPPGTPLPGDADLVIIPGSKATIADLADVRAQGWDIDLFAHVRRGGAVLGLCGGYQMLGKVLHDQKGMEGPAGVAKGLGLLDVETELTTDKTLKLTQAIASRSGQAIRGYEMHIGQTLGPDTARPFAEIAGRADGAVSVDGQIMGTYLHGIFADDAFRRGFFSDLHVTLTERNHRAVVDRVLDDLASHLSRYVDLERLLAMARDRP